MTQALTPAPLGNRRAEKHAVYAKILSPVENEQIDELADALREASPVDSEAIEPLVRLVAGQFWRLKKGYALIDSGGRVVRSLVRDLTTLENSIVVGLRALALTPQSAADVGLTLMKTKRASERPLDLSLLSDEERLQLEQLLEKTQGAR